MWGAYSQLVYIMGFSHNGAWGKLACQNLRKLFKSGPLWKSESRRVQQKIRFVCGISSTIACKTARYQLQLIKRAEMRARPPIEGSIVALLLLPLLNIGPFVGPVLANVSPPVTGNMDTV